MEFIPGTGIGDATTVESSRPIAVTCSLPSFLLCKLIRPLVCADFSTGEREKAGVRAYFFTFFSLNSRALFIFHLCLLHLHTYTTSSLSFRGDNGSLHGWYLATIRGPTVECQRGLIFTMSRNHRARESHQLIPPLFLSLLTNILIKLVARKIRNYVLIRPASLTF